MEFDVGAGSPLEYLLELGNVTNCMQLRFCGFVQLRGGALVSGLLCQHAVCRSTSCP